jgi:hypothetical protein
MIKKVRKFVADERQLRYRNNGSLNQWHRDNLSLRGGRIAGRDGVTGT